MYERQYGAEAQDYLSSISSLRPNDKSNATSGTDHKPRLPMYINGIEDSSKEFAATDYVINSLQLCSSGSYFRANARMAQVRFWKKALSASAIKDGMSRLVAPDSDGLFGYWKLDDGSGSIYHDATGNGYDLTCRTEPEWGTEEVDFSDPNK